MGLGRWGEREKERRRIDEKKRKRVSSHPCDHEFLKTIQFHFFFVTPDALLLFYFERRKGKAPGKGDKERGRVKDYDGGG